MENFLYTCIHILIVSGMDPHLQAGNHSVPPNTIQSIEGDHHKPSGVSPSKRSAIPELSRLEGLVEVLEKGDRNIRNTDQKVYAKMEAALKIAGGLAVLGATIATFIAPPVGIGLLLAGGIMFGIASFCHFRAGHEKQNQFENRTIDKAIDFLKEDEHKVHMSKRDELLDVMREARFDQMELSLGGRIENRIPKILSLVRNILEEEQTYYKENDPPPHSETNSKSSTHLDPPPPYNESLQHSGPPPTYNEYLKSLPPTHEESPPPTYDEYLKSLPQTHEGNPPPTYDEYLKSLAPTREESPPPTYDEYLKSLPQTHEESPLPTYDEYLKSLPQSHDRSPQHSGPPPPYMESPQHSAPPPTYEGSKWPSISPKLFMVPVKLLLNLMDEA